MSKTMNARIGLSTTYEAYIDLWGYSPAWINTIQETILNMRECRSDDEAESYSNPACMAVWYSSPDKKKIEKVCAKANSLMALAKKTLTPNCSYDPICF